MRILLILTWFFAAAQTAAAAEIKIAAFGDSLSAGYNLPEKEGFAPELQRQLRAMEIPARVINAAVPGDTSSDGLARVEWMLQDKPDIVIVEFGANDMFRATPLDFIEKNLAQIIMRIQQNGARVLLAGMEAPSNYNPIYRWKFSRMYKSLGGEYDVPLYPFFLEGVALNPQLNLPDGIHPNAEGVRIIARNIAPLVAEIARELP